MTRYRIIDINAAYFDIDSSAIGNGLHESFMLNNDSVQADVKIIEKTFRDGGVFSGNIRLKSKEIEFSYYTTAKTDALFRAEINPLIFWCRKAVLLQDLANNLETTILFDTYDIKYEEASHLRLAKITITFKRLTPYWENSTNTVYNISGSTSSNSGTLSITNNGWLPTQPIITIDAHELTTKILFHVLSTNEGIYIKDLQFGLTGLSQYIINNIEGTIKLSGNKRNNMIQQDTGFFEFPVGTFDLDYDLNGDCDISIVFKERYYI
jgi:hypothetical protein